MILKIKTHTLIAKTDLYYNRDDLSIEGNEDEIFFTNRQQKLTMTVKQQYLVGVAENNGKRGNVNTFKGMMC